MTKRQKIIETGKMLKSKGVHYKLGAKAIPPHIPAHLDCSGFVRYCYLSVGLKVPDGTYYQWQWSEPVKDLQIGDIGIMENPSHLGKKVNHIGIYIGNGEWMHCNYSHNGITIEKTNIFKYKRRFKGISFDDNSIKQNKGENYMKEKVKVTFEGKTVEVECINDNGHRYMQLQDFWKFGKKISGDSTKIIIE